MNTPILTDLYDPYVEILQLEDRLRELQAHAEDITHAAVATLRVAEQRIERLKAENGQLRDENRALRAELRSLAVSMPTDRRAA